MTDIDEGIRILNRFGIPYRYGGQIKNACSDSEIKTMLNKCKEYGIDVFVNPLGKDGCVEIQFVQGEYMSQCELRMGSTLSRTIRSVYGAINNLMMREFQMIMDREFPGITYD